MPQMEVYAAIDSWAEKEKAKVKARAHGTIDDKVECMRLFAGQGDDLGGALGYINHLINSSGTIKLLTVHKAKGLEADDIFILDEDLIGDKDQEPNLRYVAITRAKQRLTYIYTKEYEG